MFKKERKEKENNVFKKCNQKKIHFLLFDENIINSWFTAPMIEMIQFKIPVIGDEFLGFIFFILLNMHDSLTFTEIV